MGLLTVVLDKVEHLRDEDGFGKSDPYVKFELEQDNYIFDKEYGKQESTRKQNDCSPVYNETFVFDDIPQLKNMVLTIRVMDDDVGRDDRIGFCKIELDRMGLSEQPKAVEMIVDRKQSEGGCLTCCPIPCKCLCRCCCRLLCSLFTRKATIFLKLSYTE